MIRDKFKLMVKNNNGVPIGENIIVFNDMEVWNEDTDASVMYFDWEELFKHKMPSGKTIGEVVDEAEGFYYRIEGSNGQGSGATEMGGGFNHAKEERGKGKPDKARLSAEFNAVTGKDRKTKYERTLKEFAKRYADADHEYAIEVDDRGFVNQFIEGQKTSVGIWGKSNGMILHNHPSGGNFSDSDLKSTAMNGSEAGIVAVGNTYTYAFVKGKNFKAKEFVKAMKKAQWPAHMDYNEGADWWLRRNAKTYNYTYTRQKTKK